MVAVDAGEAYVIFGSAGGFGIDVGGRQVIDLTSLSAAEGFIIQGVIRLSDSAGFSVSSAGDVNGDGFDDLIVGAASLVMMVALVLARPMWSLALQAGFGVDVGGRQVIDLDVSINAS